MALYGKIKEGGRQLYFVNQPVFNLRLLEFESSAYLVSRKNFKYIFFHPSSQLECSLLLNSGQDKCGPGSETQPELGSKQPLHISTADSSACGWGEAQPVDKVGACCHGRTNPGTVSGGPLLTSPEPCFTFKVTQRRQSLLQEEGSSRLKVQPVSVKRRKPVRDVGHGTAGGRGTQTRSSRNVMFFLELGPILHTNLRLSATII